MHWPRLSTVSRFGSIRAAATCHARIGQTTYFTAITNTFAARSTLKVGSQGYEIFRLDALASLGDVERLPYSLRILLEDLLRTEDGVSVTRDDIEALARWSPGA